METEDPFWVGWDAALEAIHNALTTQFALGYSHKDSCKDVLLDIENSVKELRKVRDTPADLTNIA